jgi:hypothetical protein
MVLSIRIMGLGRVLNCKHRPTESVAQTLVSSRISVGGAHRCIACATATFHSEQSKPSASPTRGTSTATGTPGPC